MKTAGGVFHEDQIAAETPAARRDHAGGITDPDMCRPDRKAVSCAQFACARVCDFIGRLAQARGSRPLARASGARPGGCPIPVRPGNDTQHVDAGIPPTEATRDIVARGDRVGPIIDNQQQLHDVSPSWTDSHPAGGAYTARSGRYPQRFHFALEHGRLDDADLDGPGRCGLDEIGDGLVDIMIDVHAVAAIDDDD